MIVSDTNLIAQLYIECEASPLARRLMLLDPDWVSPFLWGSEFRNTLLKCLRGGILERDKAFRILAAAGSMMSGSEFDAASADVLELASTSGCSAYDAEFVVLARDLRVPLVTTDRELLEKFPETAVSPEGFLARR